MVTFLFMDKQWNSVNRLNILHANMVAYGRYTDVNATNIVMAVSSNTIATFTCEWIQMDLALKCWPVNELKILCNFTNWKTFR